MDAGKRNVGAASCGILACFRVLRVHATVASRFVDAPSEGHHE